MDFSRPPSDQFPQPTRPTFAAEPGQSSDDKSIINRHVHHNIHHPHVTIDLTKTADHHDPPPPPPPPPPSYPTMESSSSSSSSSAGNRAIQLSPSTGKTPKGEKESVDELLRILVDCLEELSTRSRESLLMKFFSEVERDERLEKFIVDRLKQSKVKALTDLYDRIPPEIKADAAAVEGDDAMPPKSRSVVESAEELTLKLERFKIKTLDFEGEEEKEKEKEQQGKDKSQGKPTT